MLRGVHAEKKNQQKRDDKSDGKSWAMFLLPLWVFVLPRV